MTETPAQDYSDDFIALTYARTYVEFALRNLEKAIDKVSAQGNDRVAEMLSRTASLLATEVTIIDSMKREMDATIIDSMKRGMV